MMTSLAFSYKNYNVQKRENRFSLGLNAAKNTHRLKKVLNKSCSKLNFIQKCLRGRMYISSWSGAGGGQ